MSTYDKSVQTIFSPTVLSAIPNTEYFILCNSPSTVPTYSLDATYRLSTALLHMDGTNGSTVFTDNSILNSTWNSVNSAQLSTAQARFGTASFLQTSNRYISSSANNANFQWGTSDFSVEYWFFPTSNGAGGVLFDQTSGMSYTDSSPRFTMGFASGNKINWGTYHNTSISGTTVLSLNTWHHIAVTRASNTVRLFVNGVLNGSVTDSANFIAAQVVIGGSSQWNGVQYFQPGYYDELRLTKGLARYTAAFTPPTSPFINGMSVLDTGNTSIGSPTLPSALANSCIYHIKNISNFTINVFTTSSQTIEGSVSWSLQPSESISLVSDSANWRIF